MVYDCYLALARCWWWERVDCQDSRMNSTTLPKARTGLFIVENLSRGEHVIHSDYSRVTQISHLQLALVLCAYGQYHCSLPTSSLRCMFAPADCPSDLHNSSGIDVAAPARSSNHHALLFQHSSINAALFHHLPMDCGSRSATGGYGAVVHFHPRPGTGEL